MIIFQINKNSIKNDISKYNRELLKFVNPEVQENFVVEDLGIEHRFSPPSYEDKLQISKIKVLGNESESNPFKNRVLYIQGSKLNRITDVFFGDIKGTILNSNNILNSDSNSDSNSNDESNGNSKYILPPDFTKYGSFLSTNGLKNIEIKFLISHDIIVNNPNTVDLVYNDNNANVDTQFNTNTTKNLSISIANTESLRQQYLNKNLRMKVEMKFRKLQGNKFKMRFNDFGNETSYDIEFEPNNNEVSLNMIINVKNFVLSPFVFEKIGNNEASFKVPEVKIVYMFDDINSLYPTGLFYRLSNNSVTTGENLTDFNTNDWSVFLGDRLSEEQCSLLSDEIKGFYDSVRDSLGKQNQASKSVPEEETNYAVTNLIAQIDQNDKTQIKISWDIPDSVKDHNFTFLLDFEPTVNNDKFKILNEKIAFDKDSYIFSNKKLIPKNKYNITIKTLKYKPSMKVMGSTSIELDFTPDNIDAYHSHLFTDGKFNYDVVKTNPELVKTYYQLTEYNKGRTADNLIDTQEKIEDHAKCMNDYLNETKKSKFSSSFDSTFASRIDNDIEEETRLFDTTQDKQKEQIQKINNKLAELEKLKNIKEEDINLNVKSLKSLESGEVIRLQDIGNEKKLVLLNNGCLAFSKNKMGGKDDYGYIPCNHLDKEQHFQIRKINNLDEYNDLLTHNIQPLIPETMANIQYPFYILQPVVSTKCVNMKKDGLSIEPCSDDNYIRFNGYIDNSDCNV